MAEGNEHCTFLSVCVLDPVCKEDKKKSYQGIDGNCVNAER